VNPDELAGLLGLPLRDACRTALEPLFGDPVITEFEDRCDAEWPNHGIAIIAGPDGRVTTIQFFSEGRDTYRRYSGELPFGLRFECSRDQVRKQLGVPEANRDRQIVDFFGQMPGWDRFCMGAFFVHVEYDHYENNVRLVSVIRPDAVPR
jgi:hypothetical protein